VGESQMSEHERLRADLPAHALGALPAGQAAELERHLGACDACRRELRWLRPAVELLPESIPQVDPPPALRERLMAEVRADASRAAVAQTERTRLRRGWGQALRPAVGLAAIALVAAGVAGYAIRGNEGGTQTIAGPVHRGKPTAKLAWTGDSGTLQLSRLGQLPSSEVYEAWVQRGERLVPSSLFVPRADGTASAAIPRGLDGADAVLVTAEPRGGSLRPTSAPTVSVPLG
jgi:anti-sigma-K factor RskA